LISELEETDHLEYVV